MIEFNSENIMLLEALNPPGSDDIAEKMNQIFPSLWVMIATFGALIVLLIILTKFLYNPITKMVKKRQDFIKNNINKSIEAKEKAFNLENEANLKLKDSYTLSQEIISKAKIEAENIKNQYLEQAKIEASKLIKDAKENIQIQKLNLEREAHNEIVSIAIDISEKIIKEKITEKESKKYLDKYLESKNNV